MSEPLAIYLQDHLAGARFATKLLKTLRDQHPDEPLGEFAAGLLEEIHEDRSILEELLQRVRGGRTGSSKNLFAWLGETTTRMKLHRRTAEGLGTVQKLETLGLGVLGKRALWKALAAIAEQDDRLGELDFEQLASRAESQHARVEARRLQAVVSTFGKRRESP